MEAIYFGNASWQGNKGGGSGPWVGADLGITSSFCSALVQLLLLYSSRIPRIQQQLYAAAAVTPTTYGQLQI